MGSGGLFYGAVDMRRAIHRIPAQAGIQGYEA